MDRVPILTWNRQRAYDYYFEKVVSLSFIVMSAETKSGEYSSNNAFIFNGNNGNLNNNNKYNSNSVRPVTDFRDNECYTFGEFHKSMRVALRVCYKNKRNTPNALRFRLNETENLMALSESTYQGEYIPGKSIIFLLQYPVLREAIAADFRDRVVQTWLVMRIEPLFQECGSIPDQMYSCRVGKGNLAAIKAVCHSIYRLSQKYTRDCTVAKFDISSFFMSIDKRRLYEDLVKLVTENYHGADKDMVLYLMRITTFNLPTEHCIRKTPICEWAGLPASKSAYNLDWFLCLAIGNLWSQTDANFYNAPIVRYILKFSTIDVENYVDDFYLGSRVKEDIHRAMSHIREELKTRGLTMHPHKYYEQPYQHGIKILGGVVKCGRMYISNRTVGKLECKVHYYNTVYASGHYSKVRHLEKFISIINSYFGLMRHFCTFNIRKRVAADIMKHWEGYLYFTDDLEKAVPVKKYKPREIMKARIRRKHRTIINILNTQYYGNNKQNQAA